MDKDKEKKTAPEVPAQEQQSNIYPLKVVIVNKVGDGISVNNEQIIDSSRAIKVTVEIDNPDYDIRFVEESIKSTFQTLLGYYS